jgi:PhoH-like ATPase
MSDSYTGVKVLEVEKDIIDAVYKDGEIEIWDKRLALYENMYVVLKDSFGSSSSALCRVKGGKLVVLPKDLMASGISPKNKEQRMALDALLDDNVKVVALTGRAGTGKSLLAIAAALEKKEKKIYDRIILTKPQSQVTKYELGILPGTLEEKINPFFESFICSFEFIFGPSGRRVESALEHYNVVLTPMQLIRGMSWHNSIIIADEVQVLTYHDMVSLGTRVAEGSKLILLGDLAQRDEKIAKDKTGLFKFVNSDLAKNSKIVSSIELIKSERSEVAELFADVFEAF